MSTEGIAEAEESQNEAAEAAVSTLIISELDYAAHAGRSVIFEAAKQAVEKAGGSLSHPDYSRFGLQAHPAFIADSISEALENDKLDAETLAITLQDAMHNAFRENVAAVNPVFTAVVESAKKRSVSFAVYTVLPEDIASTAVANAGLDTETTDIAAYPDCDKHFPRVDTWLKIARNNQCSARGCIAVVSSNEACKTAIAAGMRVIAIPDAFTGHQDFSGADAIIDSLEDVDVNELLNDLI